MRATSEARAGSFAHGRTLFCFLLAVAFAACGGGGGGGGGSTPTGPTPPANQLFTLSGIVTEGPATSGFEGYFRDDTGGNEVGGFGRGEQSVVGEQSSVLGEQSREREQPDQILIDDNPDIADPLHAAAVGDTLAGVVVQIIDGPHMGKSATTGSDGSYQIVGVSGGMTLTATKSGYKTQTKSGTVSANTTLNFALAIDIVTYTLSGYVREDGVASSSTAGEPISGVVVRVTDGPYIDKSATTGSDGRYEIVGVVGGMTLSATKTDYVTFLKSVTVISDTTLDFDIGIETRNISGLITEIETGAAVVNLTVDIEGVGATTTDGDGRYRLETELDTGILPMTLSAAGYIRRDTYLDAGGALTANATVIADGGDYGASGFSLAFHDEVFRKNGTQGTKKWISQPPFQIWMRKLSCTETDATDDDRWRCAKATVLDESVSGSWFYNTLVAALAGDVGTLTGGKYGGAYTTHTPEVGAEIDLKDWQTTVTDGVSIAFVRYPDAHTDTDYIGVSFARTWSWQDGSHSNSWVVIDDLEDRPSTFTHEIAHTLGFGHPNGYDFSKYPGGSIMGGNAITTRDILQGRILYLRPLGSLTPDIDPSGFKVNAAMYQRGGGRGYRIMEIHCCR